MMLVLQQLNYKTEKKKKKKKKGWTQVACVRGKISKPDHCATEIPDKHRRKLTL